MTGYGRGESIAGNLRYYVEMRSVNHRFAEIVIRLPSGWSILEEKIKNEVQKVVRRGRVDVWITVDGEGSFQREVKVDWHLATSIVKAAEEIKERFQLPGTLGVEELLRFPDVLLVQESPINPEAHITPLFSAVKDASLELLQMRLREGQALKEDLLKRVGKLEDTIHSMKKQAPVVVDEYKARLMTRLKQLEREEFNEDRLLTEVVLFAEKVDIQEELTRLQSHLEQFAAALESSDPVGRRLDFLLQEMNREVNTIGSKAQDRWISSQVVECKSELEKMREQVQNIE